VLFFTQIDNEEHHPNYIYVKPEDVWNQPDQDLLVLGGCFYLDKKVKFENKFPAFTKMRHADSSLTVLFYTVSYAFALVFVPIWSQFLLGQIFPIPTMIIIRSFLLVIGAPLLMSSIFRLFYFRNATKERRLKIKAILDKTGFFGLAVIIFSIFAERGQLLLSQPGLVLKVLPAAALLLLGCLFSGIILSKIFGLKREIAEAVIISGTTKNTVIALAIAASAFSNNEAIIIAICGPLTQLPFMLLYVRLAGVLLKQNDSIIGA